MNVSGLNFAPEELGCQVHTNGAVGRMKFYIYTSSRIAFPVAITCRRSNQGIIKLSPFPHINSNFDCEITAYSGDFCPDSPPQ